MRCTGLPVVVSDRPISTAAASHSAAVVTLSKHVPDVLNSYDTTVGSKWKVDRGESTRLLIVCDEKSVSSTGQCVFENV